MLETQQVRQLEGGRKIINILAWWPFVWTYERSLTSDGFFYKWLLTCWVVQLFSVFILISMIISPLFIDGYFTNCKYSVVQFSKYYNFKGVRKQKNLAMQLQKSLIVALQANKALNIANVILL